MKYLQEVTDNWKCEYRVPNHIYMINGIKAIGYIKEGTTEKIMFSKPIFFDRRNRKFKELKSL